MHSSVIRPWRIKGQNTPIHPQLVFHRVKRIIQGAPVGDASHWVFHYLLLFFFPPPAIAPHLLLVHPHELELAAAPVVGHVVEQDDAGVGHAVPVPGVDRGVPLRRGRARVVDAQVDLEKGIRREALEYVTLQQSRKFPDF